MDGKKFVVKIRWGDKNTRAEVYEAGEYVQYSFGTRKELEAFLLGANQAIGWHDYDYVDEQKTEWDRD